MLRIIMPLTLIRTNASSVHLNFPSIYTFSNMGFLALYRMRQWILKTQDSFNSILRDSEPSGVPEHTPHICHGWKKTLPHPTPTEAGLEVDTHLQSGWKLCESWWYKCIILCLWQHLLSVKRLQRAHSRACPGNTYHIPQSYPTCKNCFSIAGICNFKHAPQPALPLSLYKFVQSYPPQTASLTHHWYNNWQGTCLYRQRQHHSKAASSSHVHNLQIPPHCNKSRVYISQSQQQH